MTKIIDIDELFAEKPKKSEKTAKEINKEKTSASENVNTRNFLSTISKEKLARYMKKLNNFKTIAKQKEILAEKLKEYKKLGDTDNYDKTYEILNKIKNVEKEFKNIMTYGDKISSDDRRNIIDNSDVIKKAKEEMNEIKKQLDDLKPNVLLRKLKIYRERIKMVIKDDEDMIYDFDSDDDLDNLANENEENSELIIGYNALCEKIGNIIGKTKDFVAQTPIGALRNLLKEFIDDEKVYALKSNLDKKDMEIKIEISKICGDNITDVIFENFDLSDDESMSEALDIIASSKTNFVSKITYILCRKYNMLHEFDDVLGFGMLALSEALNKWKAYQMLTKVPINIDLFLGIALTGPIQRGIYLIRGKGTINEGVSMGIDIERRRDLKNFKADNPDLAELPDDQIEQIYNYYLYANGKVNKQNPGVFNESQMADAIAASIEDNDDMFTNSLVDNTFVENADNNFEYEEIVKSIRKFFSLFKKKYDKTTGEMVVSEKKRYFDKWDLRIFEMLLTIRPNPNSQGGVWNQKEIAEELSKLAKEEGISFSQPAVSDRINKFWMNLDRIKEEYPALRPAVEFFKAFFASSEKEGFFETKIHEERESLNKVMMQIYEGLN